MRVQIPLVVEFDDEQVQAYAEVNGLPYDDGPLRAKDIVNDVQRYVLTGVQDLADFSGGAATVTIKGR